MQTPSDIHPFRNSSEGAKAKREKLLGARRADLAIMSHAIRHTYVRRSARVGASLALFLGGSLVLAASLSPAFAEFAASLMPGASPAPLVNLLAGTWMAAVLGGLLGRNIAERRFTLAMSRAVLPSENLHQDVARLAGETPDDVGRRMAQTQARRGRALPILATGVVLPTTAMAGKLALSAGGYPSIDKLEALITAPPTLLIGFASLAAVFAAVLYLRPRRAMFALPVLTIGSSIAVGAPLWPFIVLGALVLALMAGFVQRREHKEDVVLGQDGAPIPKPLHVRKRLRAAGQSVVGHLRHLRTWRPRRVHVMGAALAGIMAATAFAHNSADVADAHTPAATQAANLIVNGSGPDGSVHLLDDSFGLTLLYKFEDGEALFADGLLDGIAVPAGWRATITVQNVDASGAFFLSFFDDAQAPRHLAQDQGSLTVQHDNCDSDPVPLRLSVTPYGQHYRTSTDSALTVRYHIQMELMNDC